MNGGFDYGIIALGLGGLAFITSLGIRIWEIASTFKSLRPGKGAYLHDTVLPPKVLPITVLTQKNNQPPTTPNVLTKVKVEDPNQAPVSFLIQSEEAKTTSLAKTSSSMHSPNNISTEPVTTLPPTRPVTPLEQVSERPKRTPPFPPLFAKLLKS